MGREREVAGGKIGLLLWFLDNIIMAALQFSAFQIEDYGLIIQKI